MKHCRRSTGFTVLETMIAIAIVAVLAVVALPAYNRYVERARLMQAVNDILAISLAIGRYAEDHHAYPESLDDVNRGHILDPWGRPYRYQDLSDEKGKGRARKDRRLNPLNSDFDLYSVGKDGLSKLPLPPPESHDDVVRARNGRFVGFARDFDP